METIYQQYASPSVIWVPCILDHENGKFVPVYNLSNIPANLSEKVPSLPRGGKKSKPWKRDEDLKLRDLVQAHGIKKWARVAEELNSDFDNGRRGKNCRERWNNHLDPEINKGEWSYDEDLALLVKHKEIGRKWSIIAKDFKGRTENSVKNRWSAMTKSVKSTLGRVSDELASDYLISHLSGLVSN